MNREAKVRKTNNFSGRSLSEHISQQGTHKGSIQGTVQWFGGDHTGSGCTTHLQPIQVSGNSPEH